MARNTSFQSALTRAPMLRLVLPFIGGLVLARWIRIDPIITAITMLGTLLVWHFVSKRVRTYPRRWLRGALLLPVLLLFGMCWQELRAPDRRSAGLSQARRAGGAWDVRVTEVISSSERSTRLWARVIAALDSASIERAGGGLLLTLMRDSAADVPGTGDELIIHARIDTIERIPDPGGFDQRAWAASYGVFHQAFVPAGSWSILMKAEGYASFFEGARGRIAAWLEASDLDARERGMVKAILLGIRDELDQDQKTAFARSGTMHVLAVSGSHVALIYGALLVLFKGLGERRRSKIIRSVIILLVLWAYAGITGATPSVLRATATFTLFCFADMVGRTSDPINSLAGAAFILLLWDPLMLGQLSFQLSFLAVLGIALFYRPLMHLWAPPNAALHYFWSLFSVSVAAQLMTTPLALLSFKAFPTWFLPANLVIVGLVALGVYGGAILLVVQWITVLREAATGFMVFLLECIGRASEFFAGLPGAYPAMRVDTVQCILLYALVLCAAGWVFERWAQARTGTIAALALLLLSWGGNAHLRNNTLRFIVYDERDRMTCAVEDGRSLTVFADTLDVWSRRKVLQHDRSVGALAVDTVFSRPATLDLDGARILFGGGSDGLRTGTGQPDLVVLTEDIRYDGAALESTFGPRDGYVLAATISAKHRTHMREWAAREGVAMHDVRLQGAYVR